MKELERHIVNYSAPTLARLKAGSLFTIKHSNLKDFKFKVNEYNEIFAIKGIKIEILKNKDNVALIYVYRKDMLKIDFENNLTSDILKKFGYENLSIEESVSRLKNRLSEFEEFPHEIGLFLGYPPEDVNGFICNGGKNCNLCGYWKVYGDTKSAMIKFAKYDKCKAVYKRLWQEGRDILRLAVA